MRREPGERVPIATRLRGEVYNQLIDAAEANDRPVASEIELRLEQSFRDDRIEARLAEIERLLRGGAVPTPDEWWGQWAPVVLPAIRCGDYT